MTSNPGLRALVGTAVEVKTTTDVLRGRLVSCTRSSLWLVEGDDDYVVPLPDVRSVTPR